MLTQQEAYLRHAAFYMSLFNRAEELYLAHGYAVQQGLFLFDSERENIETGWERAVRFIAHSDAWAQICTLYTAQMEGCILSLRFLPKQRVSWLKVVLASAQKLNQKRAEAITLGQIAKAYQELGDYEEALFASKQALEITCNLNDLTLECYHLGLNGSILINLAQFVQGVAHIQQAHVIATKLDNRRLLCQQLIGLGKAYASMSNLAGSIECLEQALLLAREQLDRQSEGTILSGLGTVYANLGQLDKSLLFLQEALVIAQEMGDKRGEHFRLGNLGDTYRDMGQYPEAVHYLERAVQIAQEMGDRGNETVWLRKLAISLRGLGATDETLVSYHQTLQGALTIAVEIKDRIGECNILSILGESYTNDTNDLEKAFDYLNRANQIALSLNHQELIGIIASYYGNAHLMQGNFNKAIDAYEKACLINHKLGDERRVGLNKGQLGIVYHQTGETQLAIEYLKDAIKICQQTGSLHMEVQYAWQLGLIYEKADPAQALKLMSKQVKYEREIGHIDAEKHAAQVAKIREKLSTPPGRSGSPRAVGGHT